MSIDQLDELGYGDIIEIGAGLTRVVGYYINRDERMIYIAPVIPKFPSGRLGHVSFVPESRGFYYRQTNLELEILKKSAVPL